MALELFRAHAERGSAVVSIQVVQEYFVAASKKLRLSVGAARAKVEMISLAARVIRPSAEDVLSAIDLHSNAQGFILGRTDPQAARRAGANTLYTEDLQPGFMASGRS
jgi:predicted nucleic acid-binding protein